MEWFGSPSRRMVTRFSIAVLLTDDLTGAPVTGSNARVWIEGQKPPVRKPDGRHIFVDLPEGEYVLIAEGGIYSRTEVKCTVSDGRTESLTVRLVPNRQYPVSSDTLCIEGNAEPGAVIRTYPADKTSAYKLLYDVKKGSDIVGIYHGDNANIEGKLLKIISPDDKGEYIRIKSGENSERSEYRLTEKLRGSYPKIGTVVAPVSECTADADGRFMILLRSGAGRELVCEAQGSGKPVRRTIDISGTGCVKADLT